MSPLAFGLALAADPSSVERVGDFSTSTFSYYYDGKQVVVADTAHTLTVERSAIIVEREDLLFESAVSYRVDRGLGPPDTLIGGFGAIRDPFDPDGPPLIDHPGLALRQPAYDVSGNGLMDLLAYEGLVLVGPDAAELVSFPQLVLDDPEPWTRPMPMPDLDGDGHADLLESRVDGWWFDPPYEWHTLPATITMFPGGPNGYAETPSHTFRLSRWPVHAIPFQADEDPEWEILAVIANRQGSNDTAIDIGVAWIDDPMGSPVVHETRSTAQQVYLLGNPHAPSAAAVSDLDGDGLYDVVLLVPDNGEDLEGEAFYDLHLLGSTRGFEYDDALARFAMLGEVGLPGAFSYNMRMLVVDVDQDGHQDLLAAQPSSPGAIQVWFGPLYVPPDEPPHTAHTGVTGHTGASTTPTSATADTAPSATDIGSPDDPPEPTAPPADEPRGCGCRALPTPPWPSLGRR